MKSTIDRFNDKWIPEPNSGCWLWTGATNLKGYGQLWSGKKTVLAHRTSWELYRKEIPSGMCVLHKCDIPLCVNPDHLFIGTRSDNMTDMWNKNRAPRIRKKKTHCKRGHEFTEENTIIDNKWRRCRICRNINQRKLYKEKLWKRL